MAKNAAWPDTELEDEDELLETIAAAYASEVWDIEHVRALLERGGRRRAQPVASRADDKAPALLKAFLSECGTAGHGGPVLLTGERSFEVEAEGDFYSVFGTGTGDFWVASPGRASEAFLTDHESGGELFDGCMPLGQLLAAWLFNDELMQRGLGDHSDADIYASELCPFAPQYVFFTMTF